jgi:hypothetical protein
VRGDSGARSRPTAKRFLEGAAGGVLTDDVIASFRIGRLPAHKPPFVDWCKWPAAVVRASASQALFERNSRQEWPCLARPVRSYKVSRSASRHSAPNCCDHSCSMRTTVARNTFDDDLYTHSHDALLADWPAGKYPPSNCCPNALAHTSGQSAPRNKRNSRSAMLGYCEGWFKPRKVFSQKSNIC